MIPRHSKYIRGHTCQGWKAKLIRSIKEGKFGKLKETLHRKWQATFQHFPAGMFNVHRSCKRNRGFLRGGIGGGVGFVSLWTLESPSGKLWIPLSPCCSMLVHHWAFFPFRLHLCENKCVKIRSIEFDESGLAFYLLCELEMGSFYYSPCLHEGDSSILAGEFPWTEETGRLQAMGLQSWTWLSN